MKKASIINAAFYFADKIYGRNKPANDKEHERISKENKELFEKAWLDKYHGGVKPEHWDFDKGDE